MRTLLITIALVAFAAAACQTRYVLADSLNMRSGPGTGYRIVGTAAKGQAVCFVSKTADGWVKLDDGNYVSAQYLGTAAPAGTAPACQTRYVNADSLNVRSGPGTGYGVVRSLSRGATVCFVSKTADGWVKLDDGNYVSAQYLATSSTATSNTGGSSSATASGGALSIAQKSSPNKSSRNGHTPDVIVCHITEGGYSGAVSWLCNTASQASCHFVVSKKGEVSQLVPLDMSAWCNGGISNPTASIVKSRGSLNPNRYTVGIEHEGFYSDCKGCLTDAQKNASGKLIKHIVNQVKSIYGTTIPIDRDHIIGHYQIDAIDKPNCPGQNFPWADVIAIAKSA